MVVLALTNRTFDVLVAVGAVVGTGVATFVAFLGGAAVVARQYRREREHRSAVTALAAFAGLRQGVRFLHAVFFAEVGGSPEFRGNFKTVHDEMSESLATLRRERGLSPDALIEAIDELQPVAGFLRDAGQIYSMIGVPESAPPAEHAAISLQERTDVIEMAVQGWLKRDVRWWRREPLQVPVWAERRRVGADEFVLAHEASIVRGAGPATANEAKPESSL